jgi:hypothetical protein
MAHGVTKAKRDAVIYLYGIGRTAKRGPTTIPGVDDLAPVEPVACGTLTCWISRVGKEEFADKLATNIENLEWLTEMTPRHQRAVAAIAEEQDVLPARFGTVFLNEASLRADVENRKAVLLADLKRIQGNEEWGVKVFAAASPRPVQLPRVSSGKSYLEAKSARLRARQPREKDDELTQFAKELEKLSVDAAEGGKISGGRRDLRYQVSLLLKRSDRKRLQSLLRKFAEQWKDSREIECTGPWPPYSFVSRPAE